MKLSEEFRTRAERCLKLAHQAPTLGSHTHWLAMAQLWFQLAEYDDAQDAAFLSSGTVSREQAERHGDPNTDQTFSK
jgi:hypothetical protein